MPSKFNHIPRKAQQPTKKQQAQVEAKTALLMLRVMEWAAENKLRKDGRGWWFSTDPERTYTDAEVYLKFFTDTKDKTNVNKD